MRWVRVAAVTLVIGAALAGEWLWLQSGHGPSSAGAGQELAAIPAAPPGGPFALTDHTGKPVSDETFRGKYLVMVFGYTFCPDVCPTTLGAVAAAMDLLGTEAEAVQPLFVTVDPTRDTPAVLADYVAAFHPRLVGLTGSAEQIRKVTRDYRVYVSKVETGDDTYTVDHSAYVYLVGPDGHTLSYLKHDASPQAMAETIGRHMSGRAGAGTAWN
jgi:protein SCO1/2